MTRWRQCVEGCDRANELFERCAREIGCERLEVVDGFDVQETSPTYWSACALHGSVDASVRGIRPASCRPPGLGYSCEHCRVVSVCHALSCCIVPRTGISGVVHVTVKADEYSSSLSESTKGIRHGWISVDRR